MALTKAVIFSMALCMWRSSDGYAAIGKVPVQNGSCMYNGTEVPSHEPLKLEHPCEEWACDLTTGELSTIGCHRVEPGRGCIALKGRGVYPDCCEQIACY
ncbi:complement inhibitor CirpT4-like [Rhipicephalus microplus]|uniref:complement inhibitor CirpT4-like n=1 Tax=Rhipicephalus microplus TaxID=6941 RepID=UPI002376C983